MRSIKASIVLTLLANGEDRKVISEKTGLSIPYITRIATSHGYRIYAKKEISHSSRCVLDRKMEENAPVPKFFAKHEPPKKIPYPKLIDGKRMVEVNEFLGEYINRNPYYRVGYSAWH